MTDLTIAAPAAPAVPRAPRRWPLILLALPAAVATWSGWVGLGEKTGFGVVKPLPGILDDVAINTAVMLPIGVEAYAAFALSAWLNTHPALSASTRRFAGVSALGSLLLGMLGQIAYHLLATHGYTTAPAWVTTAVSCLPVLVLGMGAGLGHMISRDLHAAPAPEPAALPAVEASVEPVSEAFAEAPAPGTAEAPAEPAQPVHVPAPNPLLPAEIAVLGPVPDALYSTAAFRYAEELGAGKTPALARLKRELRIGQERATGLRAYLGMLAKATS
ncbi:hypothetical protein ACIBG7_15325 [Nonomuraea sp. NPDC050328]|uniref:hypothetical protein n=1 Tax=Nonomuraea sp. NPDC050328 TaxID=3364361 RepID=UPI00379E3A03